MAFTGLGVALCSTTGKYIGARSGGTVPALIGVALVYAALFVALICSALYGLRLPLARLFTTDAEVVDTINANILGAVLSVPGYATLMTLYGACQGANYQRTAFLGTALGYAFGIPLGYVLGPVRRWPRPLLGVWLGNVAALAFAAVWVLVLVACKDWERVRAVTAAGGDAEAGRDEGGGASVSGRERPEARASVQAEAVVVS